jgi:hypothetical protein
MKAILRFALWRLLKAAKHAAVMADAKKIARRLNSKVDLPVLSEAQEQVVFENALAALQQALR